jgi:hypothetical protein
MHLTFSFESLACKSCISQKCNSYFFYCCRYEETYHKDRAKTVAALEISAFHHLFNFLRAWMNGAVELTKNGMRGLFVSPVDA